MKVVLTQCTEGIHKIRLIKLIRSHHMMPLRDAKKQVEALMAGNQIELAGLRDPTEFHMEALRLGATGHVVDDSGVSMLVILPRDMDIKDPPVLTAEEAYGAGEALAAAIADPTLAWALMEGIKNQKMTGPWENDPTGKEDSWVRRDMVGNVLATTWWEKNEYGGIIHPNGARYRISGDGDHETITVAVAVAVAQNIVDSDLRISGWQLGRGPGSDKTPPSTEATIVGLTRIMGRCGPKVAAGVSVGIMLRFLSPWHTSQGSSSILVAEGAYEHKNIWHRVDSWGGVVAEVWRHELNTIVEFGWELHIMEETYEGRCVSEEQGKTAVDEKLHELGYYWASKNSEVEAPHCGRPVA